VNPYWDAFEALPREEIERYQARQLKWIVEYAYRNSRFFHDLYKAHGIHPSNITSLADVEKLPLISKEDIRKDVEAHPPLGVMTAVPPEEVVYVASSSGSTGIPTPSPFTREDFEEWIDVESRLFWSSGLRPSDVYVHGLNFALFVGGPCVLGAQRLGATSIWVGAVDSSRFLFTLQFFKATATWITPSYALYLSEVAEERGFPLDELNVKKIFLAGEPGASIPSVRRLIESRWNAEVYDYYGLSDIFGALAAECTERCGLHVAEDHVLVEVVDPHTGESVAPGEEGELVLTTLRKRARPLIRFRTGDITRYEVERCSCGRTLIRLLGISGRIDEAVKIKGVLVYPSSFESIVRDSLGYCEFRVVVQRVGFKDSVTLEVECPHGTDAEHAKRSLENLIRARLGISVNVKVVPRGTLPRTVHKAKRFIDLRKKVEAS